MPAQLITDLKFEEVTDVQPLNDFIKPLVAADVARQPVPVPESNTHSLSKVAKTRDGRLAGGIVGTAMWNALRIGFLAVNPDCRVRGTGTALMKAAEDAAWGELQCNQIYLGTFSWQARPFYEKLGYRLQWTLQDHPRGHSKHFLEKVLPVETRHEAVQAYDTAPGEELVIEDWDRTENFAQVTHWMQRDTVEHHPDKPILHTPVYGLKVCGADGSLVAACVFDKAYNTLFIYSLAVAEALQRRGVGSALLRQLDVVAREKQCDFILVATRSWEARPFFEKNGYRVMYTQPEHPVGYATYTLLHQVSPPPNVIEPTSEDAQES